MESAEQQHRPRPQEAGDVCGGGESWSPEGARGRAIPRRRAHLQCSNRLRKSSAESLLAPCTWTNPTGASDNQRCAWQTVWGGEAEGLLHRRVLLRARDAVSGKNRLLTFRYAPNPHFSQWLTDAPLPPPPQSPERPSRASFSEDFAAKALPDSSQAPSPESGKNASDSPAQQADTQGWAAAGVASSGVQTLQRESEAQTDPFSAQFCLAGQPSSSEAVARGAEDEEVEAVVRSADSAAEELLIAHLCWGRGLPASQVEIRAIQEMRARLKIEVLLPPPTDEFCLGIRAKLLNAQEIERWAKRDRDIREIQERRLELVAAALQMRASDGRAKAHWRLQERAAALKTQQRREALLLERQRVKALRRTGDMLDFLEAKFCAAGEKGFSLARGGTAAERKSGVLGRREAEHRQALARLSASLALRVAKDSIAASGLSLRDELCAGAASASASADGGSVASRKHKRNPKERPDTPRIEPVAPEEEAAESAVLLLQRLLRSCARRKAMLDGRANNADTVSVLRAAEQLREVSASEQRNALQRDVALEAAEALLASSQGAAISKTLDDLAKAQRQAEERRRVSALVELALRERRLREAQERGMRAAEEMLRVREDEAFRAILERHNQTVDSYLHSIIQKAGTGHAQKMALVEARLAASQLCSAAEELEALRDPPRTIVGGLVKDFLLPRLAQQQQHRERQIQAHKFQVSARAAVEEAVVQALQFALKLHPDPSATPNAAPTQDGKDDREGDLPGAAGAASKEQDTSKD